MRVLAWGWFTVAQLITLTFMVIGFVVLIIPCLLHAWELSPTPSINDGRKIDRWTWSFLNPIWGNPEDGVSGQTALVWINGTTRGPYWPTCPNAALRAYAWSAWRNSCDQLKYRLAVTIFGTPAFKLGNRTIGWSKENGKPVLVI